ncbi:hypothetical protein ACP70R_005240 [Stipagrostis hirtigluma subsp. patula]
MDNLVEDGKVRLKHRFSARRFIKVVSSLSDKQKGFVVANGFGSLLHVADFKVPVPFLEWIMDHMVVGVAEFIYKRKTIKLSRHMVFQVLGIPSGNIPINLDADDSRVTADVIAPYMVHNKSPIKTAIDLLSGNENEESFMRSFMLVALATLICPSTQNNVNLKYLNVLMDVSQIRQYDWASHALQYIVSEVKKFQGKVDSNHLNSDVSIYIGSCLPLLAIVYMDYLDLHHDLQNQYRISYSVPRICHVSKEDFKYVVDVDRDRSCRSRYEKFGVIPFRDKSSTPYVEPSDEQFPESPGQLNGNSGHKKSVSAPAEVHSSISTLVNKHSYLLCNELSDELASFAHPMSSAISERMSSVFSNRLSMMSSEILTLVLASTESSNIISDGANVQCDAVDQNHACNKDPNPSTVSMPAVDPDYNVQSDFDGNSADELNVASSIQRTPTAVDDGVRNLNDNQDSSCFQHTPVDVGPGLGIAMSYASELPNPVHCSLTPADVEEVPLSPKVKTGPSTIEKKKRKRRAAISLDKDDESVKLKITDEMEDYYIKYVRCQYIAPIPNVESPDFVVIGGFHSSYERFRDSLRPRGHVFDDVMALFVQLFNIDHKHAPDSRIEPKKIAFSPFLTSKLFCTPENYVPESTEAELTRINAELNVAKADLLFFPISVNDHWVVICIDMLAEKINFLNSAKCLSPNVQDELINYVVRNFQRTCAMAEIFDRDLNSYGRIFPAVPYQSTTFDCGIYVMLFMLYFNGRTVKNFDSVVASMFRRMVAYRLITCPLNEIDPSSFSSN